MKIHCGESFMLGFHVIEHYWPVINHVYKGQFVNIKFPWVSSFLRFKPYMFKDGETCIKIHILNFSVV